MKGNTKVWLALLAALVLVFAAGCPSDGGDSESTGGDSGGVTAHVDDTSATGYVEISDGNYYIYDAQGLKDWAALDDTVVLSSNVTLKACINWSTLGENWTPVGDLSQQYTGTFDGGGHTVSGLTIVTTDDYAGFFGYVGSGGTVQDLGVEISSISAVQFLGGIAGRNGGTITGCHSTGNIAGDTTISNGRVGGIAGYNRSGTIKGCYSSATVVGGSGYIGGIAGYGEGGQITACYFTGDVSATGSSDNHAGGIVGRNNYSAGTRGCYSTGDITATEGTANYAGGIAGSNGATITTCYWSGTATGGVGNNSSSTVATKVDGDTTTWLTAQTAMNENSYVSSSGWEYYGASANTPPTLKKSS